MNGNHLPAGQPMPGGVGGVASGHGMHGGRRRPPPPSYSAHQAHQAHHQQHQQHHHHQHQQPPGALYPFSHLNPYANAYYSPQQMAHHYQTGHMHNQAYPIPSYTNTTYQQRSPPPVQQTYPLIVSSSMQTHPQPYARPPPQQPSPALSTPPPLPTAAPPPPAVAPETPTSTHSSQAAAAPLSPVTPQSQVTAPPPPDVEVPPPRVFLYPLPWLSLPDEPFPSRASKFKKRRRKMNVASSVELPTSKQNGDSPKENTKSPSLDDPTIPNSPQRKTSDFISATDLPSKTSVESSSQEEHAQHASSTSANTPSTTSISTETNKSTTRTAVPAVPVIPIMPKASSKEPKSPSASNESSVAPPSDPSNNSSQPSTEAVQVTPEIEHSTVQATKPGPKLWSNLFQSATPATAHTNGSTHSGSGTTNSGMLSADSNAVGNGISGPGSFAKSNASSLAEALRDYQVSNGHKIAFIEPRGLVNTGNMCYMNSVLQALIFCTPFYDFLDHVSKAASHSFKSETPLIDAMIMFLREYKVIHSASSEDQLRKRLKNEELEQYGDAFTPEIVYDAMKRLQTFATMQRGHQQDAEEFLGFLLQALDNECTHVMRQLNESSAGNMYSTTTPTGASTPTTVSDANEWLEVGRKQRAAVTRSSGLPTASSPISKVFSGQLRSTLRVPGLTDSVTFETYQPLQLDIGDAHVNNIVDALKHLTRSEKLTGDFGSPRVDAKPTTKQVLIESVPPVLILHLKRFSYNASENSTGKLWKNIDYPLELELPKEMFSPAKRNALHAEGVGSLKYRLTAAVYHHGKSASGGHYTVDLRRQDGQEWIRVDDTVIRRIRSEDVAESSADGNTSKSTTWVDQKHSVIGPATGNRFEGINQEDGGDEEGWNKVGSPGTGAKKWSSVANTNGSSHTVSAKSKSVKDSIKDNKVAYLLFYQKI
ncbi:hypothetical protein F4860DRAFT_475595 [Xylaria cubensis]|nr:hypothetical protein F4860DRAFT_475595 [Xylaria cubensis]